MTPCVGCSDWGADMSLSYGSGGYWISAHGATTAGREIDVCHVRARICFAWSGRDGTGFVEMRPRLSSRRLQILVDELVEVGHADALKGASPSQFAELVTGLRKPVDACHRDSPTCRHSLRACGEMRRSRSACTACVAGYSSWTGWGRPRDRTTSRPTDAGRRQFHSHRPVVVDKQEREDGRALDPTRFLERPGSLQLSQVQVLIVVSSLP